MGSSKASFRFEAINMRGSSVSIFILGFGCVLSAPQEYPGPAPPLKYDPQIGQTNVDGYSPNTKPYCHMEEKVVFENQCEPYTEKTCWTQNEEDCKPVMYKNCTGVIQTNVDRVCFNVNELSAAWLRIYIMKLWKRLTRFSDASQGRIVCVILRSKSILRPKMITNVSTSKHPTATWRRRSSMT